MNAEVVEAFEISPVANEWYFIELISSYFHNFKKRPSQKSIESLTIEQIDKFNANCWLLSPPCQPYARAGIKFIFIIRKENGYKR